MDGAGDFNLNDLDGYDLAADQEVEIVHTTIPSQHKTATVTNLTAGWVSASTVSGGAADGSTVDVWLHNDGSLWRTTTAAGGWSVDFSTPGTAVGEENARLLEPGEQGAASQCNDAGDCTFADWSVPGEPWFGVDPFHNSIEGWGWPSDVGLTITVDDTPFDWSTDGGGNFQVWSDQAPAPFDVGVGDLVEVEVTGGEVYKSHTVTSLVVNPGDGPDRIAAGAVTISGAGDPGEGPVQVEVHVGSGQSREVTFSGTEPASSWVSGPDFTPALVSGDNGVVTQTEADDFEGALDQTRIRWQVPAPSFTVDPVNNDVWGDQWEPGAEVTVTVYESAAMTVEKGLKAVFADGSGRFHADLSAATPGPVDVEADDYVTVTDGASPKSHSVIDLSVGVDADSDVVSGTTDELGFDLDVWVDNGPQAQEVSPGTGGWSVDFATEYGHDIQPGETGGVNQPDVDGDRTQISWEAAREPWFGVDPFHNSIEGWGWPSDVGLTITVDDTPFDWSTDGGGNFQVWSDQAPAPFDVGVGDLVEVEVTGGEVYKSHTVTSLVVNPGDGPDRIAAGAVTISGAGDPGEGPVQVEVHVGSGQSREVTFSGTEPASSWVSGPDFTPALVSGDNGVVTQTEADDFEGALDQTRIRWQVPAPSFTVDPVNNDVWGDQWEPGAEVTVTVYESAAMTVEKGLKAVFADGSGRFHADLSAATPGPVDVEADDYVTVTDGASPKSHSVIDLSVGVDADSDVVSGTTDELGFDLDVWVDNGPQAQEVSPGTGGWSVDFATEYGHDIQPGETGGVNQPDVDGDRTQISWEAAREPWFGVDPFHNSIEGWGWPSDVGLTITVDDTPFDWSTDGGGNFQVWSDQAPAPFDVGVGDLVEVEVTGGEVYKSHTVTSLVVNPGDGPDRIAAGAVTISGAGDPGEGPVQVEVHVGSGQSREVTFSGTEPASSWVSGPDFTPALVSGDNGVVTQTEADDFEGALDQTRIRWQVPAPSFTVDPVNNDVWGDQWEPGAEVTVTVYESAAMTVEKGLKAVFADGSGRFHADLSAATPGPVDVEADDYVTVTDGASPKSHSVIDLSVGVDADSDVVSGTTDELGFDLDVWVDNGPQAQEVSPGTGGWSVDFATEYGHDIQPGETGGVNQPDVDGDRTQISWEAAREPWFGVDPFHNSIEGWGWPSDVGLTITVDDTPFDWSTDGGGNFQVWSDQAPAPFDVGVGDLVEVEVTGGEVYKSHTVTSLVVNPGDGPDRIAAGAVTISGAGDPGEGPVQVEVHVGSGQSREVTFSGTEPASSWVSGPDFTPALVSGDNGVVTQTEADDFEGALDQTRIRWQVPAPSFTVDPVNNDVWGDQWEPGAEVTVTVYESAAMTVEKGLKAVFADGSGRFHADLSAATPGPVDVEADDYVTVTDGASPKSHSVIDLSVGVDADSDVVSGTTDELGFDLDVWVDNGPQAQEVSPGTGGWSVDFATEYGHDIQPGETGGVNQPDVDGDRTQISWEAATPASVVLSGDNVMDVFVNGELVGSSSTWMTATSFATDLAPGDVVGVHVEDLDWSGGLLAEIDWDGSTFVSDTSWQVTTSTPGSGWNDRGFDDSGWVDATSYGSWGVAPWLDWMSGFPLPTDAQWIWSDQNDNTGDDDVYFRWVAGTPSTADDTIVASADNVMDVYVNGVLVGSSSTWMEAQTFFDDLSDDDVVGVHATDNPGAFGFGGFMAQVDWDGNTTVSDTSWKVTTSTPASDWADQGFNDSGWDDATAYGLFGVSPWMDWMSGFPSGSDAQWIWSDDNIGDDDVYFRKVLGSPDASLDSIVASADNTMDVFVNGVLVGSSSTWMEAQTFFDDLSDDDVVGVHATDNPGAFGFGGFMAQVDWDGNTTVSDTSWKVTTSTPASDWADQGFNDSGWDDATAYGPFGVSPWMDWMSGFPSGSDAQWIWSDDNIGDDDVYFRKVLGSPDASLDSIVASADNTMDVYVNGELLASSTAWMSATSVFTDLSAGDVVAVYATDLDVGGLVGGFIAQVDWDGMTSVSDAGWKVTTSAPAAGWNDNQGFDESGWVAASVYGAFGDEPWMNWMSGFPDPTSAQWIWSGDNEVDNNIWLRYTLPAGP